MKPSEYRDLPYNDAELSDLYFPCPFLPCRQQLTGRLWDTLAEVPFEKLAEIHPTWLHIYLWELLYCPIHRGSPQIEYNRFINFRTQPAEYISVVVSLQNLSKDQLPYAIRADFDDLVRLLQRTLV